MNMLTITDITISEWALILVFSGSLLGSLYIAGLYTCQVAIRLAYRNRIEVFRRWRADGDLLIPTFLWMLIITYYVALKTCLQKLVSTFDSRGIQFHDHRESRLILLQPVPLGWFIFETVLIAGIAAYLSLVTSRIVIFLINVYNVSDDISKYAVALTVVAFATGFLKEFGRTNEITTKVDKLTDLHPRFRQLFTTAELLSVYEILRTAPDWLWEEYSKLEKWQINETTNRKYRELAAPYQHNEIRYINKAILAISIVALAVAIIAATVDLSSAFWSLLFKPTR